MREKKNGDGDADADELGHLSDGVIISRGDYE